MLSSDNIVKYPASDVIRCHQGLDPELQLRHGFLWKHANQIHLTSNIPLCWPHANLSNEWSTPFLSNIHSMYDPLLAISEQIVFLGSSCIFLSDNVKEEGIFNCSFVFRISPLISWIWSRVAVCDQVQYRFHQEFYNLLILKLLICLCHQVICWLPSYLHDLIVSCLSGTLASAF